jgi:2-alkyl-3-oxoalkanoate reductase
MKALVTGGGGFIGSALVHELVRRGFSVTSFSRGDYPELRNIGVTIKSGDLTDIEAVLDACTGIDIVFHVAAKAGIWGPYKEYYSTNVLGTENIVRACIEKKIKWLIYTSSASVVFNGTDIEGSDESLPYPSKPLSHYAATKALAEKYVLKSDSANLKTIALRPHIVLGQGDNHLVPRIISQAKAGKLWRIGNGKNRIDISSIENVVAAHLCAAQAIKNNPDASGKAYFISNGKPVFLWDHINSVLEAAGINPVSKSVPESVAYIFSAFTELIYKILMIKKEPRLTRFLVLELSRSHWFDISAARKILGYNPLAAKGSDR